MKTTPFTQKHLALGAKMHEFAGYNMPIEYPTGITKEHIAVRKNMGVFDVSHMGEFWVRGANALPFLQKVTSNDVSKLTIGKAQYSYFPNHDGGIVDDLLVYRTGEEEYLLVVNAGNIQKDWEWCVTHNTEGAELDNASDRFAQLAIQGPHATSLLQQLTSVDLAAIPYYSFTQGDFAGIAGVIISNTGYTGAGGFELYFAPEHGAHIWNRLFEVGDPLGLLPIGLGARDTLRLEMGYCLYGNDIDDTTSPIEAGLGWITKFVDNKPFINRESLYRQKTEGVGRRLLYFQLSERGIPRHDYEITDAAGITIGRVTSGGMNPATKVGMGMGYVATAHALKGETIYIKIREKLIAAQVVR